MMRKIKTFVAITTIFAALVLTSGNVLAYSANEAQWRAFPQCKQGAAPVNYTKAIQTILFFYSPTCQSLLQQGGGIDGIFGSKTKAAVIEFQRTKGLSQDGIVGPNTWQALYDYLVFLATVGEGIPEPLSIYTTPDMGPWIIAQGYYHTGVWYVCPDGIGDDWILFDP